RAVEQRAERQGLAHRDEVRKRPGLRVAEEARREGRASSPGEGGREVDDAVAEAGRVSRRVEGRPVQAGSLPLLIRPEIRAPEREAQAGGSVLERAQNRIFDFPLGARGPRAYRASAASVS